MRRIVLGRFVEAGSGEVSKGFPVFYEALELPEARYREWRGAVHCKRNMRDIDLEWSGCAFGGRFFAVAGLVCVFVGAVFPGVVGAR